MNGVKEFSGAVLGSVRQRMFGVDNVVKLCITALYTGGHVLLEGNPGLGKTELVKTLGKVLKLPFGRIQFTPDLMPTDITGTYMPDLDNKNSSRLLFRRGPVFTSLLLADEINRATPKTQSAMLEAMAEGQVTVLGKRKALENPFMVLATQNPIDHEGTYNLPEAQADRFMFKTMMPVPNSDTLRLILGKKSGESSGIKNKTIKKAPSHPLLPKSPEDSREKYEGLRKRILKVVPLPSLETHLLNMFLGSNRRFNELVDLDKKQVERTTRLVEGLMTYGLGPRAAISMMLGAKAYSLMFLPDAENATGESLARVAIPALRHRVMLDFDWEHRYGKLIKKGLRDEESLREKMLTDFCIATAPKKNGYQLTVKNDPLLSTYSVGENW